jgi:Zn-dependent protease with chaperone function
VRRTSAAVLFLSTLAGCASVADRAYYPLPGDDTRTLSHALHRAAEAAADDPARYSFALIASRDAAAYSSDDATFYFTEGLARQPRPVIDALIAHEVAHEVLGHAGQRRALSLSLTAGFTVLGVAIPGASLLDFAVSPLIVRAFTRDQEMSADLRAVEILRVMGYRTPKRTLAEVLRSVAAVHGTGRRGGVLSSEPLLDDRLAVLEPLEPKPALASTPGQPR